MQNCRRAISPDLKEHLASGARSETIKLAVLCFDQRCRVTEFVIKYFDEAKCSRRRNPEKCAVSRVGQQQGRLRYSVDIAVLSSDQAGDLPSSITEGKLMKHRKSSGCFKSKQGVYPIKAKNAGADTVKVTIFSGDEQLRSSSIGREFVQRRPLSRRRYMIDGAIAAGTSEFRAAIKASIVRLEKRSVRRIAVAAQIGDRGKLTCQR